MLSLLAFIPGIGMVAQAAGGIVSFIANCRICMIALGIVVVFIAGDIRGHHKEAVKCKADDLAMQLAAAKRDLTIQMTQAKFKQDRLAELSAENAVLSKTAADFEASLTTGACLITKKDIQGLGRIK